MEHLDGWVSQPWIPHPEKVATNYLEAPTIQHEKTSLNRCGLGRILAYDLPAWKAGKQTPGKRNNCPGEKFDVNEAVINNIQGVLTPEDTREISLDQVNEMNDSGFNYDETDEMNSLSGEQVGPTINIELEQAQTYNEPQGLCPRRDVQPGNDGDALAQIRGLINAKEKLEKCTDGTCCRKVSHHTDFFGHPDRRAEFNRDVEKFKALNIPKHIITEELIRKYEEWIQLVFPSNEEARNLQIPLRLKCRLCKKYIPLFGVTREELQFTSTDGVMGISFDTNKKLLLEHSKIETHQMVMSLYYKVTAHEMKRDFKWAVLEQESEKYKVSTR